MGTQDTKWVPFLCQCLFLADSLVLGTRLVDIKEINWGCIIIMLKAYIDMRIKEAVSEE